MSAAESSREAPPEPAGPAATGTFAALAAARRAWLTDVLRPWCRAADRSQLRLAEAAWRDLAGDVDPAGTLWAWAWERFPALCEPGLTPPAESRPVRVTLTDGRTVTGTPDARRSLRGELWLTTRTPAGWADAGPFPLDEIAAISPAEPRAGGTDPPPRPVTMPH